MITEPTLFIIGAGASAPYGYPTGEQLKNAIINQEPNLEFLVDSFGISNHAYNEFCQLFDDSNSKMIDYFLATNNDDEITRIGKFLISANIILAEK